MLLEQGGIMGRAVFVAILTIAGPAGCVLERERAPGVEVERPSDVLKRLVAEDASLAAKLEADPAATKDWFTKRGRWDDPSRRIRIDPGPLALILYPTDTITALIEFPAMLLRAIAQPRETDPERAEQLRRIAEERAEQAFPRDGRPPR
jgi:hypothetical protein